MISYALAPAEKGEEDKVYQAMAKLLDEDVTLQLSRNEETGDMLLAGMGQTHIENAVEKAKRRYKVTIRGAQGPHHPLPRDHQGQGRGPGPPQEADRRPRPVRRLLDSHGGPGARRRLPVCGRHRGRLDSAPVYPRRGQGRSGVRRQRRSGGIPLVDFKVEVFDGSFHTVDSSEMAFKIAGSVAFKAACEKVKLVLLEPIALASVSIPDAQMGDVIGDLSSRRGKVLGSESAGGVTEVQAHVPMSEMQEYAKALSSMTGGQGAFTMSFDHYEEAPPVVTEKVVAEYKKSREE